MPLHFAQVWDDGKSVGEGAENLGITGSQIPRALNFADAGSRNGGFPVRFLLLRGSGTINSCWMLHAGAKTSSPGNQGGHI